MAFKPLPIGVDNFQEMIEKEYYYIDKTLFIKELLDMKGKVNLLTRPRRFGKTLNLSMLQCFFEMDYCHADQIFRGLAVMEAGEEYTKHMSQYPVISISLKSMKQAGYELSYTQMKKIIAEEFRRHDFVLNMDKLTDAEKERYQMIRDVRGTDSDYLDALQFLSFCLKKCSGKKTIILIDEYDVPLENAYFGSFYNHMIPLIRSLFESALKTNEKAFPQPFWSNTSSNSIVKSLIEGADIRVRQEIEDLIQGESIEKPVHEDMTYDDMEPDQSRENLWNFLFFTGYLKKTKERMNDNVRYISMSIPNEEVRYIYKNTVLLWFEQKVRKKDLSGFYKDIIQGNAAGFENKISQMLREGISFYDTKESFYHGFIMGLLNGMEDYYAYSNRESGDGRYDICLKSMEVEKPVVIMELKLAASYADMEEKSQQAAAQIEMKHYKEDLKRDGYQKVLCYGIAFYKKNSKIILSEKSI